MFILWQAVSGHHYLMLQMESCKQMLVVPLNGNSISGCGSSTGEKEDPKMLRHDNGDKHELSLGPRLRLRPRLNVAAFEVIQEHLLFLQLALIMALGSWD